MFNNHFNNVPPPGVNSDNDENTLQPPPGIPVPLMPPGVDFSQAPPKPVDFTQTLPPVIDFTQAPPLGIDFTQAPPPGVDFTQDTPPGDEDQRNSLPSLLTMHVEKPASLDEEGQSTPVSMAQPQREQKLPHALEKALAFKTQRAAEVGGVEEVVNVQEPPIESNISQTKQSTAAALDRIEVYQDDELEDVSDAAKKKKDKRKKKKKKKRAIKFAESNEINSSDKENIIGAEKTQDVEIEYIQEKLNIFELEPQYRSFVQIFEVFRIADASGPGTDLKSLDALGMGEFGVKKPELTKVPKLPEEDDMEDPDKKNDDKPKLSKRKLKKLTRLSIAELKQLVSRPDVVEMHDVTARDPKLLVQLKAHRNTVPVPRHWCFKRKYLQGKRGIEKPPFNLPDFIKKTGIMEMRSALQEKEESKAMKAKMRERARPKMGKIDIDYQKLHDAFFKWQTKPKLTIHGDLYYEGKEFETRLKEKKPGELSDELKVALGMPPGAAGNKVPPPWLIAMQRYGPPPSYPNLKIPGLNSPIPDGCSFGYHAGGWGKPPVDETGRPLYGDVFATNMRLPDMHVGEEEVEKSLWGELESESESESEEEEEDENESIAGTDLGTDGGLVTPSGIASIPQGIETPETIELRKKKAIESEMEESIPPPLYTVLPERKAERVGTSMMASTHVYDVAVASNTSAAASAVAAASGTAKGIVEVALDPSELDLDSDAMAARYEAHVAKNKEDLTDMVAQHVERSKAKRKRQSESQSSSSKGKKYKEFKF